MPIEIRELVIRARVEDQQNSSSPASNSTPQRMSESDLQKIVSRCAEEVLKILTRQKEK